MNKNKRKIEPKIYYISFYFLFLSFLELLHKLNNNYLINQ